MSKFSIIPNGGGAARYAGCPTFTGTYMKPGVLDFREIAVPSPIDWTVGDYVVYTRTGFTYRLYSIPQVKKQARSTEYGGAFVYQNVQFFDDTKQLEICPFRDLVPDDNRIHFSTQPSISTFEAVDGIARRIQACLDDMYPNKWTVQLATTAMGASADLVALMAEAREFTVSGVSLLGALDKVYEVWPEVGWTFSFNSTTGKNVITIGGAGLSSTATYEYGKGNGLTSITRVVANADEMATRIFAYGSSRNMLPRWYNNQNIKDAESVDIQNLMLPVNAIPSMNWAGWGLTDVGGSMLPDAAKAFLDASQAVMDRLGLRPKTYYFDGTGDLPEIYPSVREMTIGMVRTAKGNDPTAEYYPKTTVYTNANARVDTILSAPASFDSGLSGNGDGKESTYNGYSDVSGSDSRYIPGGNRRFVDTIISQSFAFGATDAGIRDISFSINLSGTVNLDGIESATVTAYLCKGHPSNAPMMSREFRLEPSSTTAGVYNFAPFTFSGSRKSIEAATYYLLVDLDLEFEAEVAARPLTYSFVGGITANLSNYRDTTFKISIRQVGFDINAQAALGEGKTIAMRSGKCAGRAFTIKTCTYVESTDSWLLEVIRSQDDSLSQWFPNTDYPIVAGDEFVLLDIAMPDEYILVAEQRLLAAAQELLADVSVERWQYTPEIDAKFMVENSRTIYPAQNMVLEDDDIVDDSPVSILIDTVTINEGEAAIPTYKVTLRDRKKKSYTESKGADNISSNPVTKVSSTATSTATGGSSYFTLDENGNVTLKPQYENLWVTGWMVSGGVGENGGGGGGSVAYLNDLSDVNAPGPSNYDLLRWDSSANSGQGAWVNVPQSQIAPSIGFSDLTSHPTTISGYGITDAYTSTQVDNLIASIVPSIGFSDLTSHPTSLSGYGIADAYTKTEIDNMLDSAVDGVNVLEDITTEQNGIVKFTWHNGDIVNVDFNHEHSNYVPITRTINGHPLSTNITLSATADLGVASWAMNSGSSTIPFNVLPGMYVAGARVYNERERVALITVGAISYNLSSDANDKSRIVWEPGTGGTGSWHFYGNVRVDGWLASGGEGSNGSSSVTSFYDLTEIDIDPTALSSGEVLKYDGTNWTNTALKTINGTSIIGTGNISISGGSSYSPGTGISITSNTISLDTASSSAIGGLKVYSVISTPSVNAPSTTAGKYYYVQCDSNGLAFVNVPWVAGSSGGGTLTEVGLSMPTGFSVSGSPLTADGTISVSFDNGYSLPTNTKQGQWDTAYSTLTSSKTKNYVLAAPAGTNGTPSFRALVASDIPSLSISKISDLSLWTGSSNITSLGTINSGTWNGSKITNAYLDKSTVGVGSATISLGGSATLTQIGVPTWAQDTNLAFASLPSIYVGRNAATNTAGDVTLLGILGFTTASSASASGDTSKVEWDPNAGAWHFYGNIYADGQVTAGGVGEQSQYVRYVICASNSDYTAITDKDSTTLYIIGDPVTKVCLGNVVLYSS